MAITSNGIDESELIDEAKKGNGKALAQLVKNYEQTVYNFSYKICRNRDKAEHTMQETFMSMIKSLNQFSGKSKLSTWLYTIVSNHCLMLARSKKRHDIIDSFDDDDKFIDEKNITGWKIDPESVTENNELKNLLDESVQKLPAEYRIVFMLRDVEGFSTKETAEMTELSVPAVKSRLHRARAFLRKELDERLNDQDR